MPQRPRSHQLEDKSIAYFENQLPDNFLCRKKEKDYGVDLEVELFDENDSATGFVFNVQMKATDDKEKAQSVSIEVDRLKYLASLDVPAILVRYCEVDKSIHWKWIFNIDKRHSLHQKQMKINFDDDDFWHSNTPEEITRTLHIFRLLKQGHSNQKFHTLWVSNLSYEDTNTCHSAIETFEQLSFLQNNINSSSSIPIKFLFDEESVAIKIDCIMSNKFKIDEIEQDDIESHLLYGIIVLLKYADFMKQAQETAKFCLENRIKTNYRNLASLASSALLSNSQNAFEFAILNDLHEQQDEAFGLFYKDIIATEPLDKIEFNAFLSKAIEFQKSKGINVSGLEYSLGSNWRSLGERAKAVASYNAARKTSEKYLERDYFWKELGGMLFMERHYSWSAIAYEHALNITPSTEHKFGLADALLYARNYSSAKRHFSEISDEENSYGAETRLKILLCDWFEKNPLGVGPSSYQKLFELVNQSFSKDKPEAAFEAQLALAFYYEDDEFVWANLLLLSFAASLNDYLVDILAISALRCSMQPYTLFRKAVEGIEAKNRKFLETLDQAAFELNADAKLTKNKPSLVRVLGAEPMDNIIFELD